MYLLPPALPGVARTSVVAWPRVDLNSGCVVARCVGMVGAAMAAAACVEAGRTGVMASVGLSGALCRLPAVVERSMREGAVGPGGLEIVLSGRAVARLGVEELLLLCRVRDLGAGLALSGLDEETVGLVGRMPLTAVILGSGVVGHGAEAIGPLVEEAARQGLTVVAGGIESECQRALLSGLGCALGEGELFGGCGGWSGGPALGDD